MNWRNITNELDNRIKKMTERATASETETTGALQALKSDLEKMKGELNLMVENKLEFLTRNIDSQTKRLKGNYEALTEALEETNKELINNFKDKVVTIKAMVAAFFQKTEE